MKIRLLVFAALLTAASGTVNAQIQKGNVMVGGDIADFKLDLGTPSQFNVNLNPKAAWFVRDNVAIGAYGVFGLATIKNVSTAVTYGVGALGRYYINDKNLDIVKHLKFFGEANIGSLRTEHLGDRFLEQDPVWRADLLHSGDARHPQGPPGGLQGPGNLATWNICPNLKLAELSV